MDRWCRILVRLSDGSVIQYNNQTILLNQPINLAIFSKWSCNLCDCDFPNIDG